MSRILVISLELPPQIGGAGIVGLQTALNLAALGHRVTVITSPGNAHFLAPKHSQLEFVGVNTHKFLRPYEIWSAVKGSISEYDRILLNDGAAKRFGAYCLVGNELLQRTVLYLQGQEVPTILEKPNLKLRLGGYPAKFKRLVEKSRYIVAVSESMRKEFVDSESCGLHADKIEVIYNGYDKKLFRKAPSDLRDVLGVPADADVLVSVSRIVKLKGYVQMLWVFADLIRSGHLYHWVVVGDGDFLAEFKALVSEAQVEEYIHFVGGVAQAELPYYLSGADVFWLLTEYYESLGNVYFEANACGIPSIGPRRGGVVEAIEDGVTGFLVDSATECVDILKNRKWTRLNAQSFSEHLSKFDLSKSLKKSKFLDLNSDHAKTGMESTKEREVFK